MELSKRRAQSTLTIRPKTLNNKRDTKINMQRREKLSQLLIEKLMHKLNIPSTNRIIVQKDLKKNK